MGRAAAILRQFGLKSDGAGLAAVRALMAERVTLSAESIRAVSRYIQRHPASPGVAGLAARALAASLDSETPGLLALADTLAGMTDRTARQANATPSNRADLDDQSMKDDAEPQSPGADPEGSDEAGAGSQHQSNPEGRHGAGSSDGQAGRDAKGRAVLAETLAEVCRLLVDKAAQDPGLLTLASPGPDGCGWLCVPFELCIDAVEFWGHFRIVINHRLNSVERLTAEIHAADHTYVLEIRGAGKQRSIRFRSTGQPGGAGCMAALAAYGRVEVLDTLEYDSGDGSAYRPIDGQV
jgi:hypothetical protein